MKNWIRRAIHWISPDEWPKQETPKDIAPKEESVLSNLVGSPPGIDFSPAMQRVLVRGRLTTEEKYKQTEDYFIGQLEKGEGVTEEELYSQEEEPTGPGGRKSTIANIPWASEEETHGFISEPYSKKDRDWGSLGLFCVHNQPLRLVLIGHEEMDVSKAVSDRKYRAPMQGGPRRGFYPIGVAGNAEIPVRLYITSPGSFSVENLIPCYRLKSEVIAAFKAAHPELGSIPNPACRDAYLFYEKYPDLIP